MFFSPQWVIQTGSLLLQHKTNVWFSVARKFVKKHCSTFKPINFPDTSHINNVSLKYVLNPRSSVTAHERCSTPLETSPESETSKSTKAVKVQEERGGFVFLFNFPFKYLQLALLFYVTDWSYFIICGMKHGILSSQEVRQPFLGFDRNQSVKMVIDGSSFSIPSHCQLNWLM